MYWTFSLSMLRPPKSWEKPGRRLTPVPAKESNF